MNTIIEEPLVELTGNPFVDSGFGAVFAWNRLKAVSIKEPSQLTKDKFINTFNDILPLFISEKWKKGLFRVFSSNSPNIKNSTIIKFI
jgi:hypothetical protein